MATPPQAPANADPSYDAFLTSARALGATIDSVSIRFERDARGITAVCCPPVKGMPPRVRFATPAGPRGAGADVEPAAAGAGGPFRSVARTPRIDSPAPLMLRPETQRDRVGKTMRINREVQTGDLAFDERVYLESEAPDAVVLGVLVEPAMRAAALKCFDLGCTSLELGVDGGLVVELPLASAGSTAPPHIESVLSALASTAEAIPPLHGTHRYRSLAARIPLVSVVGGLVAFPLYFLVDWLWGPLGSDLYFTAIAGGVMLWLVSLPILLLVLRGRAASLRDLLTSTIALGIGIPLGGTDLLLTLNGALDTSPAEAHATEALSRRRTTGKSACTYVTLATWHPGEPPIELALDRSRYEALRQGQRFIVTTRRGYLGWERIITVVPAS